MKKASEYRRHAEECHALANGMTGPQRDQLLEMAATWERLAEDRAALVKRLAPMRRSEYEIYWPSTFPSVR